MFLDFSVSAELCSCSTVLDSCFIVLPPQAAGEDTLVVLFACFVLSVYATKVDAEQV
ncbi:hypothetical protein IKN40_07780 [bacterium]|nr:hypothetical protein [bacterium]